MKVHVVYYSEVKVLESEEEWRGICEVFEFQLKLSTVCAVLRCHVMVLVFGLLYQVQSRHSHLSGDYGGFKLPPADTLYGDAAFLSQQDLAPAHSAKLLPNWFADQINTCAGLAAQSV